jgi:hypothetical protein
MEHISTSNAIPDIYAWHQIGDEDRQPDKVMPDFNSMRATYDLPERPIDINEYAWPEAQNPSHTTWYLAQLERHDLRGLRANWGSGGALHDLMADLIFHDDGSYSPNGEWYLYEYYTQMKGDRVKTSASDDLLFDAFAVVSGKTAKLIAGTRTVEAPYVLVVTGLSALGLPEEGSVEIRTIQFDWAGKTTDTGPPKDLGVSEHSFSGDKVRFAPLMGRCLQTSAYPPRLLQLVITFDPPTNSTAFAYELLGGSY